MRDLITNLALLAVCTIVGIVLVLGWIAPDGCSVSDVIFHPEACEG